MSDPYIGEIQIMAVNFPPKDWAFCNGVELRISQNVALFSLVGATYVAPTADSYRLPNLMARVPCGAGAGPGLTPRALGDTPGANTVSLTGDQTAAHSHAMSALFDREPNDKKPTPFVESYLTYPSGGTALVLNAPADTAFAPGAVGGTTGGAEHENRQPFLALTYVISLSGLFPSFPLN